MRNRYTLRALSARALASLLLFAAAGNVNTASASSHREAPSISNDPTADNTDLYAFRSPDKPNTITIIANYIPFEAPQGGPNYNTFGDDVRYEIHIKNKATGSKDDITYRFTFSKTNEDPTTFFNIRLGKQNIKTTYMVEKSRDGGSTWTTVVAAGQGIVPPNNIGPRSIESGAGLNTPYATLAKNAINNTASGETIFCGPVDDPFFVDLQGIFDLGGFDSVSRDGLAGFNCHTIALQIPISQLQKDGKDVTAAANILDADFVIGVWASASRQAIHTLNGDGTSTNSGNWIQVSRLGMPLTNEAIIPIGMKDKWNSFTPNETSKELGTAGFFVNPELGLYVGNGAYGAAVPGLAKLRLDTNSLGGGFDFRNGKIGLYGLYGNPATTGTALDTAIFGKILLQPASPRSVDILPIFFTGVPNLAPYQLATGKTGGPLSAGKPFINNFLPTLGDMLRLNMAVPATPRNSAEFSSDGLITAAVLGLTDPRFNGSTAIQNIPNMDGFPNGRRLEDDVTRIEMQAVGGLVLNAIGLWTDDYKPGVTASPVTPELLNKVTWTAGVDKNDVPLNSTFPYMALPHRGTDGLVTDLKTVVPFAKMSTSGVKSFPNSIGVHVGGGVFSGQNYPNPTNSSTLLNYHTTQSGQVTIKVYDMRGEEVSTLLDERQATGDYSVTWNPARGIANGNYIAVLYVDGEQAHQLKLTVAR